MLELAEVAKRKMNSELLTKLADNLAANVEWDHRSDDLKSDCSTCKALAEYYQERMKVAEKERLINKAHRKQVSESGEIG